MPNRLIREGFLDSEAIHALTDPAECFFHRLLLAADDAGRFDGRIEMLRARLFPLDSSRRISDVEGTLSECLVQGLVIRYEYQGKPYLQVARWQRCSPCSVSKYPWKDGGHGIAYIKLETRDGIKEFVATSCNGVVEAFTGGSPIRNPSEHGIRKPSLSHNKPIGGLPTALYPETETETETLKNPAASPQSLDAYIPRTTQLLKLKGVEKAAEVARKSFRSVAGLLRADGSRLEALMAEIAGLPQGMGGEWYLKAIEGKAKHQKGESCKADVGTVAAVLKAAAGAQ